jgi:hypothetical protein
MGSLQFYLDAIGGSAQIYDIFAVPKNFYIHISSAGIFKQCSVWGLIPSRNIELSYRPGRLQSLAELVPWNRFLGS